MRKLLISAFFLAILASCGGGQEKEQSTAPDNPNPLTQEEKATENPAYDPHRGEGKFKDVQVPEKLDQKMADGGKQVYEVKCSSCHKLSDEKLVGPGWKDVTKRRTADWVMNFVTNTDEMIDKDPAVQAQLEICLVRMPNQNLSDDDARHVYEYMRQNDGVQ